ncbi:MAG: hypothetical protein V1898_05330 [Patescibacteria group bacterium]
MKAKIDNIHQLHMLILFVVNTVEAAEKRYKDAQAEEDDFLADEISEAAQYVKDSSNETSGDQIKQNGRQLVRLQELAPEVEQSMIGLFDQVVDENPELSAEIGDSYERLERTKEWAKNVLQDLKHQLAGGEIKIPDISEARKLSSYLKGLDHSFTDDYKIIDEISDIDVNLDRRLTRERREVKSSR